jgi:hypothetical protein
MEVEVYVVREIAWPLTLTIIWGFSTGLSLLLGFKYLIKDKPHIPVILRIAYPVFVAALLMIPGEFLPKPISTRPQFLYEAFLITLFATLLIPVAVARRRKKRASGERP